MQRGPERRVERRAYARASSARVSSPARRPLRRGDERTLGRATRAQERPAGRGARPRGHRARGRRRPPAPLRRGGRPRGPACVSLATLRARRRRSRVWIDGRATVRAARSRVALHDVGVGVKKSVYQIGQHMPVLPYRVMRSTMRSHRTRAAALVPSRRRWRACSSRRRDARSRVA